MIAVIKKNNNYLRFNRSHNKSIKKSMSKKNRKPNNLKRRNRKSTEIIYLLYIY